MPFTDVVCDNDRLVTVASAMLAALSLDADAVLVESRRPTTPPNATAAPAPASTSTTTTVSHHRRARRLWPRPGSGSVARTVVCSVAALMTHPPHWGRECCRAGTAGTPLP